MRIVKISKREKNIEDRITDEMENWFKKRTDNHVKMVQEWAEKIEKAFPELEGLVDRAKDHDANKYKEPERTPYIFVSWDYKCKDDGVDWDCPENIKDMMNEATHHHVTRNRHHPEFHCGKKSNLINRDDRDKPPEEIVDATKMEDIDIGEMCADWCAMSEEKNNTPQEWAKKNINKRWDFNDSQVDLIYKILDKVWQKK
jgi:hypothetical protein